MNQIVTEKKLLVYLPELYADWEGAFLLPELVQHNIPFVIVTDSGKPVTSIGRMKATPDAGLDDFKADDISGLILIGSDSWPDATQNQKAMALAAELLNKNVLVAAICGATFAMARSHLFSNHKHTSNDLSMLKYFVKEYKDEAHYVDQLAVTDKNLITASGNAPVDFTFEVLKYLGIYSDEKRKQWYEMFKHGTNPPRDFWS